MTVRVSKRSGIRTEQSLKRIRDDQCDVRGRTDTVCMRIAPGVLRTERSTGTH